MSKYSLKKQLVVSAFLFAACILFACNSEFSSYAYEGDTTSQNDNETTGEIMSEVIDESDYILQEGGFLYEKPKKRMLMRSTKSSSYSFDADGVREKLIEAWSNVEDEVDLSEFNIPVNNISQLSEVYRSTLNANPDYFYVSGAFSYYYSSSTYTVTIVNIKYSITDSVVRDNKINEYSEAISKFKSGVDKNWSDLEKVLYINDYLDRTCEYDESISLEHIYDAYGLLVNHIGVCQGYSLAFVSLARQLGVESYVVTSKTLNHAWNIVKINDKYYMLDVTWNDPIHDRIGRARHYYFLKSLDWFNSEEGEHEATDYVIQDNIQASLADDTKYDSYFWNNINVGFEYVNGCWYGTDGAEAICSYSCDGEDFTKDSVVIDLGNIHWSVIGSSYSYYGATSALYLSSYNGKLLYTNPDAIMCYDPVTGLKEILFEIDDDEKAFGHIYRFVKTTDGKIKYVVAPTSNSSDKHILEYVLPSVIVDEESPVLTISFNNQDWKAINDLSDEIYTNLSTFDVTASDNVAVSNIDYYISNTKLSNADLSLLPENDWLSANKLSSDISITDDETGGFYIYVRANDAAGNIGYASLGKIVIDKVAPVISTVGDGDEFYNEVEIVVTDDNLDKVYLDGKAVDLRNGTFKLSASDSAQVLKAVDKAGNVTTRTIVVNPITFAEPAFTWNSTYTSADVVFESQPVAGYDKTFNDVKSVISDSKDPSCIDDGYTDYTVSVTFNGTKYTDTKRVVKNKLGHSVNEFVYKWNADRSCTATGKCTRTGCNYEVTETVSSVVTDKKDSTCTEKGYIEYTANFESDLFSQKTIKDESDLIEHVAGTPCKENVKNPSCTEDGSYDMVVYCTKCNSVLSSSSHISLKYGHTGGTATCCSKAVCTRCKKEYGSFDATNHVGGTELKGYKEATKAAEGYTGDTCCSGCGIVLKKGTVIPKITEENSTENTQSSTESSTESTQSSTESSTENTQSSTESSTENTQSSTESSTENTQSSTESSTESTQSSTEATSENTESSTEQITSEEGTTEQKTSEENSTEQKTSEEGSTEQVTSEDDTSEQVTSEEGTTEQKTSEEDKTSEEQASTEQNQSTSDATTEQQTTQASSKENNTNQNNTTQNNSAQSTTQSKTNATTAAQTTEYDDDDDGLDGFYDDDDEEDDDESSGSKVKTIAGVGKISADGKTLTDASGVTYLVSNKIKANQLKKSIKVADKNTGGKYNVTKVVKKSGKVSGGTVTYVKPYNSNSTNVTIPDKVTIAGVKFDVSVVDKNTFKGCKNITSVVIGKNVKSIGSNTFKDCKKLKKITIKSTSLTKIGSNAFKGIYKKPTVYLPKKLTAKQKSKYLKMLYKAGVSKKAVVKKK